MGFKSGEYKGKNINSRLPWLAGEYLFTYLKPPGIPPDNNAAEREFRPFVIMRKTSYDFKSEEVMDSFTLYLSFHQTCKKHGMDFGKALHLVLLGKITPVLKAIGF